MEKKKFKIEEVEITASLSDLDPILVNTSGWKFAYPVVEFYAPKGMGTLDSNRLSNWFIEGIEKILVGKKFKLPNKKEVTITRVFAQNNIR